jgi:hypothetical protein
MIRARWNAALRTSAAWRCLTAGVREAERRVARLTAPAAVDDARVVRMADGSLVVGAIGRLAVRAATAARESRLARRAGPWWHAWQGEGPAARQRAAGLVLLTAAGTHVVVLVLGAGVPPGWQWLILPSIGAVIGALLMVGLAPPVPPADRS